MSTPVNGFHEFVADVDAAPPVEAPTRPLYWSVRRELWENRSIYLAPLVVAACFLFGFLLSTIRLPHRVRAMASLDPATQQALIATPFAIVPALLLVTAFLVAVFYCLDALHGERRERGILFWKSLPVSDRTTVLSKLAIPVLVLPAVVFVLAVATQVLMLMISTIVLTVSGAGATLLWSRLPLVRMVLVLLYGLVAHTLWYVPIYACLLVVSAWARRAPILWAVLPIAMIAMFERIAFNSRAFASLLRYRFTGSMQEAFAVRGHGFPTIAYSQLTPAHYLVTPGLWAGLVFAAVCIAAAVRLRRNREPI